MRRRKNPNGLKVVALPTKEKEKPWSGEEMIAAFLDDIRSGKIDPQKIMIHWFSQGEDGTLHPHRWYANVSRVEEIALLQVGIHQALEDWKN